MKMRVDRWLATLGLCSRSEAKDLIKKGQVRIEPHSARDPARMVGIALHGPAAHDSPVQGPVQTVDTERSDLTGHGQPVRDLAQTVAAERSALPFRGQPVRDPSWTVDTELDSLIVRGQPVDGRLIRHVLLHKPAGLLTAARDQKQPTVMDLLPPVYLSIGCMPVGRLDKDTTGLLLLTSDGDLNHRLLSPARHVEKLYEARVTGRLSEKEALAFSSGLELSDFTALPARLEILEADSETSLARITVTEGKFHQIKRMFSATGHEVLTLRRLRFGPLSLPPDLPEGHWRELPEEEIAALKQAAGLN